MAIIEAKPRCCIYASGDYRIMSYEATMKLPEDYLSKTGFFTVTGELLPDRGEVILQGDWVRNKKYGWQFSANSFVKKDPEDIQGIKKAFLDLKIPGLGKRRVEKLLSRFGKDTFRLLDADHSLFAESGLKGEKLTIAIKAYAAKRVLRNVFMALSIYGIPLTVCSTLMERMGEGTSEYFLAHPYELCAEKGITFDQIDSVEKKNAGFQSGHPERLDAAMESALKTCHDSGDMCMHCDALVSRTLKLVPEVSEARIKEHGKSMIARGRLKHVGALLYLPQDYETERKTAGTIVPLLSAIVPIPDEESLNQIISEFEQEEQIVLDELQRDAIRLSLTNPFVILTGGAGVGKTTVIRGILFALKKLFPGQVVCLMAPTGKAARRMEESTKEAAATIHKILYQLEEADEKYLDADVVIVDECSMVDAFLAYRLFSAIPAHCRVLLVGDADQLPSVQPGNVLKELLGVPAIPNITLLCNFRQRGAKAVLYNSYKIRNGETDLLEDESFVIRDMQGEEEIAEAIAREYILEMKKGGSSHVQVLSPFKRKTEIGSRRLNARIQEKLHPAADPFLKVNGLSFYVGDKVIQCENNDSLGVMNGEIGVVKAIYPDEENNGKLCVAYDDKEILYSETEIAQLELGFAVSIHKFQGSEVDTVLLPMHGLFRRMLHRNLLYTGVTRARKKLLIFGDREVLKEGVKTVISQQRKSMLGYFVKKDMV